MEDQLTVHQNWNLHPMNPNRDLTGWKDVYRTEGEEYQPGLTSQVKMDINAVMGTPAMDSPVIRTQARAALTINDFKDVVNAAVVTNLDM